MVVSCCINIRQTRAKHMPMQKAYQARAPSVLIAFIPDRSVKISADTIMDDSTTISM